MNMIQVIKNKMRLQTCIYSFNVRRKVSASEVITQDIYDEIVLFVIKCLNS